MQRAVQGAERGLRRVYRKRAPDPIYRRTDQSYDRVTSPEGNESPRPPASTPRARPGARARSPGPGSWHGRASRRPRDAEPAPADPSRRRPIRVGADRSEPEPTNPSRSRPSRGPSRRRRIRGICRRLTRTGRLGYLDSDSSCTALGGALTASETTDPSHGQVDSDRSTRIWLVHPRRRPTRRSCH